MILAGLMLTAALAAGPAPTAGAPTPATPAAAAPAPPGEDSPVGVTAKVTPQGSSIGDVLTLEVVAAFPKGYAVNLPIGLTLDPLHVVDVREQDPESTGEGLRKTFQVDFQYFDVGEGTTVPFELTYVTPAGEVQTLTVPARPFTVESLLANEADAEPKGDDPPISLVYPNELAETIAYTAGATLLGLLVLWLLARRFFRREAPAFVEPPIPPHELARAQLADLARADLPGDARYQEYYLRLTQIARQYVEGRFGVDALDRTTDEIRRQLVRQGERIAPVDPNDFIKFLQRSDLVKFARYEPERADADDAMTYVAEVVETTAPRPKDANEPEGPAANKDDDEQEAVA